jgi:hypothetical protein
MITPDGTHMESVYEKDERRYMDANGEEYFLAGGCEYIHRSANIIPVINTCIFSNEDFRKVRLHYKIVEYGIDSGVTPTYTILANLATHIIQEKLDSGWCSSKESDRLLDNELKFRKNYER